MVSVEKTERLEIKENNNLDEHNVENIIQHNPDTNHLKKNSRVSTKHLFLNDVIRVLIMHNTQT